MLLGVCAYMAVIVDFVPEQFTCAAKKQEKTLFNTLEKLSNI